MVSITLACIEVNNTTVGIIMMNVAAATAPACLSMPRPDLPLCSAVPGQGFHRLTRSKYKRRKIIIPVAYKENTISVAHAGVSEGITMRQKVVHSLAPSILADSRSSFGNCSKIASLKEIVRYRYIGQNKGPIRINEFH